MINVFYQIGVTGPPLRVLISKTASKIAWYYRMLLREEGNDLICRERWRYSTCGVLSFIT